MRFFVVISFLVAALSAWLVFNKPKYDFKSNTYQAQSAAHKLRSLWQAATANTNGRSWPSIIKMLRLFTIDMKTTMNTVQDEMPQGTFGTRSKVVHSVGIVATGKFVSFNNHPYTGSFKGSQHCMFRLSLAMPPNHPPHQNIVPGLAVKLLRDGVPAANWFAIPSLTGQSSYNFFASNISNHIPDLDKNANFALKAARNAFARGSKYPIALGVLPVAQFDEAGKKEEQVEFPFQLLFQPVAALQNKYSDKYDGKEFTQVLTELEPQPIYNVLAKQNPKSDWQVIGRLETTSKFITSDFGDNGLFFQHHAIENDFKVKPEWEKEL